LAIAAPAIRRLRDPALTLCLITDRRRLAAACGIRVEVVRTALISQVAGAIAGGVDVVQIRESDLASGEYVRLVRGCVALATGTTTRIVVNERVDVAVAAGAHGTHLRETSIDVRVARRLTGPEALIGRSVHTASAAERHRADATYLIAGSVYSTASKPGAPASLGLTGLREVVSAAGECPVWAVGGITIETIPEVLRCGVRGIAAIGAFIPAELTRDIGQAVEKLTRSLRFCFDSSPQRP
jgi:thiamine-phosphate pyrophosphorylase